LPEFWEYIKAESPSYAGRREILQTAFVPSLEYLERLPQGPADDALSLALAVVDSVHVQQAWRKALERRSTDPDGAITAARSMLESVCKHILDRLSVPYDDKKDDLPALFGRVAEQLDLAPSQQLEQLFKQTLGGCQTVVNGISAMRNQMGDAHGKGQGGVVPEQRYAELAVNLAGSMAVFLIGVCEASALE
jgi:hypothetical protein